MAGWWRRNAWGVVLLVPALGAVAVAPYLQTYDSFLRHQDRTAVAPDAEHWVTYHGARMRLAELSEETTVPKYDGTPVPTPKGMRVIKAVLQFDGVPDDLGGCRVFLQDTAGEQYSEGPTELSTLDGASLPHGGCGMDDDPVTPSASASAAASPTPRPSGAPAKWKTVCYFVLPITAYPSSVRIVIATELPRYALLK
jgi:hypothetical protein